MTHVARHRWYCTTLITWDTAHRVTQLQLPEGSIYKLHGFEHNLTAFPKIPLKCLENQLFKLQQVSKYKFIRSKI